ncbi:MAG: M61 family metallopeptidase [Planctomycetes bacterium]|nr:M61 family metallopeptidase [Planctomycetota bacterium]
MAPHIHYTVRMPDPASHNLEITAELAGVADRCVLSFPAWTPGSYKLREFGKNVSGFQATGAAVELLDKQRYCLEGAKGGKARVSYTIYADEFSVRTPHLDDTHAFFLGTNVFAFLEGGEGRPAPCTYSVTVVPHRGWAVATSLRPVKGKANTWQAPDYDWLGDTPFEVGTHQVRRFKALGVPHEIAFYGYGNFDMDRITADTAKVVEAQGRHFGGLPYERYLFIHHLTPDAGGGLEHLDACVCGWNGWKFAKEDDYQGFIRLVSHEYFHAFNVKRIRPAVLGPFDYSREQYTRALWVMEGLTTYYERIWVSRAGVCKPEAVLKSFAELMDREDRRPGRKVMSVELSSWLAWTKLYLADENWLNSGVSYYGRGAQVGLLLDARLRKLTEGKRSLDDVMKLAYERHGYPKPGFPEGGFEALCEEVAGCKLDAFWRDHVRGTAEMDYTELLDVYGLELARSKQGSEPWLGITTAAKHGALTVAAVAVDGPGRAAGLQPRDELLAMNSHRVDARTFDDRVKELKPGTQAVLTLFRRDRLVQAEVTVGSQPAGELQLKVAARPTAAQKQNLRKWLACRLPR